MRQISGMILSLDESDSPQSFPRRELLERQDRGDQQTRLPERECGSAPFNRCWQRTKK
jgi:hypothetical protein